MSLLDLFIIAMGVSMDAFAISVSKGLSVIRLESKHLLSAGLWFGGAQALMPLIGFLLGSSFHEFIRSVDHWASFILLVLIGINMLKESREAIQHPDTSFSPQAMFILALANSIDALAIGITFAFLEVKIIPAIILIGCTTFIFSMIGVRVGNRFGARYKSRAEAAGGLILIVMGTMILLEDAGFF